MALVSMAMSADEAKKEYGCNTVDAASDDADLPKYPYGLSISLDEDTLSKLGLTVMPAVGSRMQLTAVVEVRTVSQYENQDGKEANLSLQITDMELGQAPAKQDAATLLYGGSN